MARRNSSNKSLITRRAFIAGATICASQPWLDGRIHGQLLSRLTDENSNYVNPFIGASTSRALGEGKTFPGPTAPFGMVQLGPDTITGGDNAPGYSWDQTTIEGFSFTRMSGVGWFGDFGNLQVMPSTGPMKLDSGRVGHTGEGWRSSYHHSTEIAEVGYYAVTLDEYGIRAEVTAAPRAGMLSFTFPPSQTARIQLNLARRIGGTSTRQYVKVVGERALAGWMRCPAEGGGWGNGSGKVGYTLYFHLEFSEPLSHFGVWKIDIPDTVFPVKYGLATGYFESEEYRDLVRKGEVLAGCSEMEGNHIGFFAEFPASSESRRLLMKAGISFVSMQGAQENLAHDIPAWDFRRVRQEGKERWTEALQSIEIAGASEEERRIFYTAMYHTMIDPRECADIDGSYAGVDGKSDKAIGYTPRTIFSGWDVFRGCYPLMALVNPEIVNDEINSLLDIASRSHKGYLERWEIMNAYSGCMDGDPATSVILDAYTKGIRKFDLTKAYAACRQTASGTGSSTNRPSNEFYMEHGFVPGQISWTLDNSYFDWCVAELALAQGKDEDAKLFSNRSANYKNIYDPQVGYMRAKDAHGDWIPWRGETVFGQGCTESNPGQQTWFVPHDVYGLIELMGGEEEFARRLEAFFEKTPPSFGWNNYYNHANEPVHHVPYLFVYAGKPWLTQKWIRNILRNAYHNDVNGICGNDDVGQMSAWYVLSAMGFYPVCPGNGIYILGSPLFPAVTIHLDRKWYGGKTFRIKATNQAPDHPYVQRAMLNGTPLSRAWILHAEIINGGELELMMGPTPNRHWAARSDVRPPNGRH